jgi:hypothetical protein
MLFGVKAPYRLANFNPEGGNSAYLRNAGICVRVYTATKSGVATSSSSLP